MYSAVAVIAAVLLANAAEEIMKRNQSQNAK